MKKNQFIFSILVEAVSIFVVGSTILSSCGLKISGDSSQSLSRDLKQPEKLEHSDSSKGIPPQIIAEREKGLGGDIIESDLQLEGVCASRGSYSNYEHIKTVVLDALTETNGSNSGYYRNTNVFRVKPGSYNVSLTPGFSGSSFVENWAVFLDLNANGIFESSEKVFSATGMGTVSGQIVIPSSAARKEVVMRVSMRFGAAAVSCGTFTWGEVQDYVLSITDKPWQNPFNVLDSDDDSCLSSTDLLVVINKLNSTGSPTQILTGLKPTSGLFFDVNGDGQLSSIDGTILQNKLNIGQMSGCYFKTGSISVQSNTVTSSDLRRAVKIRIFKEGEGCVNPDYCWNETMPSGILYDVQPILNFADQKVGIYNIRYQLLEACPIDSTGQTCNGGIAFKTGVVSNIQLKPGENLNLNIPLN